MDKDIEREGQIVPDAEIYVIDAMLKMELDEILKKHSGNRPVPASLLKDLGELISRYVETGTQGAQLKGVEKTKRKKSK